MKHIILSTPGHEAPLHTLIMAVETPNNVHYVQYKTAQARTGSSILSTPNLLTLDPTRRWRCQGPAVTPERNDHVSEGYPSPPSWSQGPPSET